MRALTPEHSTKIRLITCRIPLIYVPASYLVYGLITELYILRIRGVSIIKERQLLLWNHRLWIIPVKNYPHL